MIAATEALPASWLLPGGPDSELCERFLCWAMGTGCGCDVPVADLGLPVERRYGWVVGAGAGLIGSACALDSKIRESFFCPGKGSAGGFGVSVAGGELGLLVEQVSRFVRRGARPLDPGLTPSP